MSPLLLQRHELLLSQRVENWSLADRRVVQTCTIVVEHAAAPELVMDVLLQALTAQPRVLIDPAPVVLLSSLGQGGMEFTLNYWIDDLEQGQGNLKSDILLAALQGLRAQGIALATPASVSLVPR